MSGGDHLNDVIYAIILGIIQGITEWLPVSSSGHLAIFQHYSGYEPPIFFDIMVHLGTALVVGYIFRKDLKETIRALFHILNDIRKGMPAKKAALRTLERRFAVFLIIGTIPIVIVGGLLRRQIIESFDNIYVVCVSLLITGCILWLSRNPRGSKEVADMTPRDALVIGIFQALALLPGVSRSGVTISGGLSQGLSRVQAARFSFMLFFPAIIGATVLELSKWNEHSASSSDIVPAVAGTIAAMISGYVSIHYLLRLIQKNHFYKFAYYCWALGILLLVHILFFA